MTENEDILDSGEFYIDPIEETAEYFPPLELDPDKFEKLSWKPLRGGGTNFKTHKLVFTDEGTIKFTGTFGAYLIGGLVFTVGLFVLVFALVALEIMLILFGLVFFIIGVYLIDAFTIPSFFNKRVGLYWKGRQSLFQQIFFNKEAFSVNLKDIKAIQLMEEHISSSDGSYNSYEINLVLDNNERLNIVDHGNRSAALNDAEELAEFLSIPLLNRL